MALYQKVVEDVVLYFRQEGEIDRATLGLDRNPILKAMIRWKITDVLMLVVLFVLYVAMYSLQPFQRQFYVNDLTISHPFAEHERVDNDQLLFYSMWVPAIVMGVISLVVTKLHHKVYVMYVSILGVALSTFTASVVTDILKNFIGRHRPDFIARCVPKPDTPINVLVWAKDVCTTENKAILLDGFRTTPSGHSSISFAGLLYLSLWLSGQLVITNENLGYWRSLVAGLPVLGSSLIALSRTEDYRHHFVDIFIGSILGLAIAYWSYRRIFPAITDPVPYIPYVLASEKDEAHESQGYDTVPQPLSYEV